MLNHQQLEWSPIVANSTMNRERGIQGINSYEKEIGWDILAHLQAKIQTQGNVKWLDLGCGSAKALVETAQYFQKKDLLDKIEIVGIDLVGMFVPFSADLTCLELYEHSLHDWQTTQKFDLITAIHSLHYVGDKLQVIQNAFQNLKPAGCFVANLDLQNICLKQVDNSNKIIRKLLKDNDLTYNSPKFLLSGKGQKSLTFPLNYLGADDQAGANYTKQSVVNSYYQLIENQ